MLGETRRYLERLAQQSDDGEFTGEDDGESCGVVSAFSEGIEQFLKDMSRAVTNS